MKVINVRLNNTSYDIHIEKGLLSTMGTQISSWFKGDSVVIISDSTVDQLYGKVIDASISDAGFSLHKILMTPGELSKSLINLNYVYNKLAEAEINRSSLIIAFGGGVVGDLAGFAAATYMRGLPYIQVPTTLMSQLDSSIGGKTAINLKVGKNLVGSFYHPKGVYLDPSLLDTLPQRVYCDGLAEAVKYGAIKDSELFNEMLNSADFDYIRNNIENIIYRCCTIKVNLVKKDEMDVGERQLLNFGHTIGHALEKYYDYEKYSHGEAVSLGMLQITHNSENLKLTEKGSFEALRNLLDLCKLPTKSLELDADKFAAIAAHDKKTLNNYVNLILLRNIGSSYIHQVSKEDLMSYIRIDGD